MKTRQPTGRPWWNWTRIAPTVIIIALATVSTVLLSLLRSGKAVDDIPAGVWMAGLLVGTAMYAGYGAVRQVSNWPGRTVQAAVRRVGWSALSLGLSLVIPAEHIRLWAVLIQSGGRGGRLIPVVTDPLIWLLIVIGALIGGVVLGRPVPKHQPASIDATGHSLETTETGQNTTQHG